MSAKWTNYYKLVQQNDVSVTNVTDNQEIGTPGSYGNYNWYHRVIQGAGNRITRYREWDNMDMDIDISRALDLIAEEITGNTTKQGDVLLIDVIENETLTASELETLKLTLRYWTEIQKLKSRLFRISRHVIKYGDVFFRKSSPIKKWKFIHPKDVKSAIVDREDVTDVRGWEVNTDLYDAHESNGVAVSGQGFETTETVLDEDIVRFTLNDDMSPEAPFGNSVLKPIYKTFKQKELLEDAVIIYRIQRAPERRVFYIDVGKMPPNRITQYLEKIKNEIKQKKIPSHNGRNSEIDSVYNPQCISLDTEIPLLDGRVLPLRDIITEVEAGEKLMVFSIDQDSGLNIPGEIQWAGVTRENAKVMRLTFSNGESIVCTPDHKFITSDFVEMRADELRLYTRLATLFTNEKFNYSLTLENIEELVKPQDTGCITVGDKNNNHNFGISSGVFIKNSQGEDYFLAQKAGGGGSRIETLPGGASVGEISDVEYFSDKMFRGLRIPLSYMKEGDAGGALFSDGRVGQAYITELRFSLYIERLQLLIEEVVDYEFKSYLRHIGIKIDNMKFNIVLPEPSNFGKYKEHEMYSALLSTYSSADEISYLSKKFIMKKYLQMSHEEIIENQRMKLEEIGENPNETDIKVINKIYGDLDSLDMGMDMDSEDVGDDMMPSDSDTIDDIL